MDTFTIIRKELVKKSMNCQVEDNHCVQQDFISFDHFEPLEMCVSNIIQWASFNSLTIPRHWHRQRNTASEIKPLVLEDSKLRCWFSTRSQCTFPACYVSSALVLTRARPQTQHELKQIWWKERASTPLELTSSESNVPDNSTLSGHWTGK